MCDVGISANSEQRFCLDNCHLQGARYFLFVSFSAIFASLQEMHFERYALHPCDKDAHVCMFNGHAHKMTLDTECNKKKESRM